ncbi:MAG: hypothetical protein D6696_06925 [Acidobacteria bacterium]|nr:MAG: hypothetical protein D6696_06925 [Acidobacteriota bacterium]
MRQSQLLLAGLTCLLLALPSHLTSDAVQPQVERADSDPAGSDSADSDSDTPPANPQPATPSRSEEPMFTLRLPLGADDDC